MKQRIINIAASLCLFCYFAGCTTEDLDVSTPAPTLPPEPPSTPITEVDTLTGTFSATNQYTYAICDLRLQDEAPNTWRENVLVDALIPQETYTWEDVPAGKVTVRAIDCDGTRIVYRSYQLGARGHLKARLNDLYGIMTVTNRTALQVCDIVFSPLDTELEVIRPLYMDYLGRGESLIFSTDQPGEYIIEATTCDGQPMVDAVTLTGWGELYHALEIQSLTEIQFINSTEARICAINMHPLTERGWGLNYLSVPLEPGADVLIRELPQVAHRLRVVDCDNNVLWWEEQELSNPATIDVESPEHYVIINNQTQRSICNVYLAEPTEEGTLALGFLLDQEEIFNFTSRVIHAEPGEQVIRVETCDGEEIRGEVIVASGAEFIAR